MAYSALENVGQNLDVKQGYARFAAGFLTQRCQQTMDGLAPLGVVVERCRLCLDAGNVEFCLLDTLGVLDALRGRSVGVNVSMSTGLGQEELLVLAVSGVGGNAKGPASFAPQGVQREAGFRC
jgi:hypothetical protein